MNFNSKNSQLILLVVVLFVVFLPASYAQPFSDHVPTDSAEIVKQALALVHSPDPVFKPQKHQEMDPAAFADIGFEQVYENKSHEFLARDGKRLFAYQYPKESNTSIILLHGVLSSAYMMNKTAGLLQEASGAEVFALDFRGHGQSEGLPGDVDYTGQYADDLADVVASIKQEKPHGKIIIAAHSMGGGIALNYAMGNNHPEVDGYVLLAPHLGHNSPTLPQPAPNEYVEEEPFLKIHIHRLIGLKMLNSVGENRFDNLPVLFFNLPDGTPLKNYSYRSNESMAPADYVQGLKAVNKPLLVLVGSKDEAFVASAFEPAVTGNSEGEVLLVEGATHNGIRHSEEAMQRIREWFAKHQSVAD